MRSPVIGYVFDRDGKYQYKWMFEGNMKNMASFIMTHADSDIDIAVSVPLEVRYRDVMSKKSADNQ